MYPEDKKLPMITSQVNLANLLSQAPVAMAVYRGPDHIIELANEAMCRFWDKTPADVLERPLFDVLPEAAEHGFRAVFNGVYTTGERFVFNETPVELPYHGKKQTLYYNLMFDALRDDKGAINGIMGLATDVSGQVLARKKIEESEKKYRVLIENTDVATAIYEGEDLVIVLANEAMIKLWGKGGQVIGKKLVEVLPELQDQPFLDILKSVYTTGETYSATEDLVNLLIDGRLQADYFNFSYKAVKNDAGQVYAILNMAVNVTQMVRERKALQDAEKKKSLALEAGSFGIWDFDLLNNTVELDPRCKELFSMPAEQEISPLDFYKYILEKDHEKLNAAVTASLDPVKRSEYTLEYRVFDWQGNIRWIRNKGKAYFEGEVPYRFVGTAQDITLERKLRDEQQKLLSLVDNSVELMSLLKLDNKNSYLNKAGMELLGFDTFEQMLETSIADLHLQEDFEKVSADVLVSLKDTGRWSGQMNVKNLKTGEVIPVLNNTVRIDDVETGETLAFGAVMRDLRPEMAAQKSLRDSELLFKQYVRGLPVAFYTVDVDGKILLFNDAASTLWGREPKVGEEFYCGAQKLFRADGTPLERKDSLIYKALKTQQSYQGEAIIQRPNGERRHALSYPQPMFNSEGVLTGAMNVLVDITDRKIAESALQESEGRYKQLNSELEERIDSRTLDLKNANTSLSRSNKELEQFAYIASHDLQEPLRKIQIFSDLMAANFDKPDFMRKHLEKIDIASKRMSLLVKELLNYSRLGSLDQAFEKVDLNSVIDNVRSDLDLIIREKAAVLNISPLPTIVGVPMQMYQLLLNLFTNSLKFSDKAPVISITYNYVDGAGIKGDENFDHSVKHLHIQFKDNGIGFSEDFSEKIFTIFKRLNSDPKYAGTGIGLAICKKVVENHKGHISVKSAVGLGTTFDIYLPA